MSGDFEKNPEASAQSAPEVSEFASRRARYLLGTLRLEHDPFCAPTAELELQINPEDSPFFSYFIDPPYRLTGTNVRQPLLDHLKAPQPGCVYGLAGTGKTAVKTMLEAECRALPEQTLVLSLSLGKGEPVQLDETLFWQRLTEALAVDLFVQVIEQFDQLQKVLKPTLVAELSHFWQAHVPQFGRTVKRELARTKSEASDISTWWRVWDRPVIRYTPLTAGRRQFVEAVLAQAGGKPQKKEGNGPFDKLNGVEQLRAGRSQFQHGLKLAQQCGYERLYLLIDVPGGTQPNELDIAELLRFLFDLTDFSLPIYTKLFFPQSFQPDAEYIFVEENMTLELFTAVLNWNQPEPFQKLLTHRFRTAGSWIRNLNTIIEQPVVAEINKLLQQEANQSPRFLLQTISRLIDSHANHAPNIFLITLDDWRRMVARWGEIYEG
jgi:hypothetical protein